jgi:hypothetical protein
MKKTVRLTESDLTRIVKRIMNEGVVMTVQINNIQDIVTNYPNESGTWRVENGKVLFFNKEQNYMGELK